MARPPRPACTAGILQEVAGALGGGGESPVAEKFRTTSPRASVDPQQPVRSPPGAAARPRVRAPPSHPPSPCLGLACAIKFKGFKCKYFSFIDASCLQRARFLAARLYCPISFPNLGTGEPGGLEGRRGRGALAPAAPLELEAAPRGTVSGVGQKGEGRGEGSGHPSRGWVGGTLQILGSRRRGRSWSGDS